MVCVPVVAVLVVMKGQELGHGEDGGLLVWVWSIAPAQSKGTVR